MDEFLFLFDLEFELFCKVCILFMLIVVFCVYVNVLVIGMIMNVVKSSSIRYI